VPDLLDHHKAAAGQAESFGGWQCHHPRRIAADCSGEPRGIGNLRFEPRSPLVGAGRFPRDHVTTNSHQRQAQLRLDASEPLRTLVVYTPPGQPFFCAEPVSHITDAFNRAAAGQADTGMLSLEPGETVRATLTLTPDLA